jgi:spermidine/putrescine transport system permease protein
MKKNLKSKLVEYCVSAPSFFWLFIFFLIPTVYILLIAFRTSGIYGDIENTFTLQNFVTLAKPYYLIIIWRTIWISAVATFICIALAVPTGYYMARVSPKWRQLIMVLVILPFWTNFLVRIFAWKLVLNPEGILNQILVTLHLSSPDTMLLYNSGAVLLVMIYTNLPFAILPIFAASEKFDFDILDAAMDLGATKFGAFYKVFLPGISKGLKTAIFMVMIPCLGAYVIPDLVGGTDGEMIGNIIASRVFVARNIPMAAAWSTVLIAIILLPLGFVLSAKILKNKSRRTFKKVTFNEI